MPRMNDRRGNAVWSAIAALVVVAIVVVVILFVQGII